MISGNMLDGNWRAVVVMDRRAAPEQEEAILNVFTDKLGGPVAGIVKLIVEVVAVERAVNRIGRATTALTVGSSPTAKRR